MTQPARVSKFTNVWEFCKACVAEPLFLRPLTCRSFGAADSGSFQSKISNIFPLTSRYLLFHKQDCRATAHLCPCKNKIELIKQQKHFYFLCCVFSLCLLVAFKGTSYTKKSLNRQPESWKFAEWLDVTSNKWVAGSANPEANMGQNCCIICIWICIGLSPSNVLSLRRNVAFPMANCFLGKDYLSNLSLSI